MRRTVRKWIITFVTHSWYMKTYKCWIKTFKHKLHIEINEKFQFNFWLCLFGETMPMEEVEVTWELRKLKFVSHAWHGTSFLQVKAGLFWLKKCYLSRVPTENFLRIRIGRNSKTATRTSCAKNNEQPVSTSKGRKTLRVTLKNALPSATTGRSKHILCYRRAQFIYTAASFLFSLSLQRRKIQGHYFGAA